MSNTCWQSDFELYIQHRYIYQQQNFYLIYILTRFLVLVCDEYTKVENLFSLCCLDVELSLLFNLPFGLVLIRLKVYVRVDRERSGMCYRMKFIFCLDGVVKLIFHSFFRMTNCNLFPTDTPRKVYIEKYSTSTRIPGI